MGKSVHNEETRKLMEGILKLQSVEECYAFFEDLCTVNELLSLDSASRWQICFGIIKLIMR